MSSRAYRDPAIIYAESESRTCKGCRFIDYAFAMPVCTQDRKYGRRCGLYVERVPVPRDTK